MKARLPQGYGKQNVNDLMARAQQMQEVMQKRQAELEEEIYNVTSGGGMIEISMTGKHQITKLKINPEVVQSDDVEMLEDMLAAAVNEAVRTVDEASDGAMEELTGGMNIPGL